MAKRFDNVAEYIRTIGTRTAAELREDIYDIEQSERADENTAQVHMAAERELERRTATVQ